MSVSRRAPVVRVAVLTTSFPLTPGSASGIFVERLVSNLPRAFEVTVLTPCASEPLRPPVGKTYELLCFRYAPKRWQRLAHQPGGVPVALSKAPWLRLLVPSLLLTMFVACLRQCSRSQILHANWSVNGVVAGLAGRLCGTPVVTTLRGEDVSRAATSGVFRLILKWCLRLSSRVVCVSQAIEESVRSTFPSYASKVVFIPNGIEEGLLECSRSIRPEDPPHPLRVIVVGSLIPRKGVDVVLRAIAETRKHHTVKLQILGEGPLRGDLQDLAARLGVAKDVEFVGHVAPAEIKDHLATADVMVLASYAEGRPNVVLEAFGSGIPAVCSEIDGVRELVAEGGTGMLFSPGDSAALADKLNLLCSDRALVAKMGVEARQYIVENHLLWSDTAAAYSALYRQLARVD